MGLLDELSKKNAADLELQKENIKIFSEKTEAEREKLTAEMNSFREEVNTNRTLLKDFNPVVKHYYEIADKEVTTNLTDALKGFKNEINIKVEKISRFQIKEKTKKFLVWYFVISMFVLATSMYFGINGVTIEKNDVKSYQKGLSDGVEIGKKSGRVEIYNSLPKSSQKYLDKKFPRSSFWK